MTEPLPEERITAQYDTRGPHRSSNLLLGSTGVFPVVACRPGPELKQTNATEEVGFVIRTVSPSPSSWALAEAVLEATVTDTDG
jgi:hypothetical protein